MKKLSIIVPCFNEELFIGDVIEKVLQTESRWNLLKELIIVDDGSSDNTFAAIQSCITPDRTTSVFVIRHEKNLGKGASVRSALAKATGDVIVIQDADLEYDPRDLDLMLGPIIEGRADVVYGSRFMGAGPHRVLFYFHTMGNKFLTFLSNLFTQLNLTDMETGYKMFRTEILKQVRLKENRFGFEPEVTAKISRVNKVRIYETGIAYYGRTYNDGKKINWKDGFRAIYCIIKYNVFSRR